jgi:CoA:oxalate CoA-transferase
MKFPLEGIRVLDLTHMMAGPFCSMLLADMGAEVIKVEPLKGDETRTMGVMQNGESALFLSLNRNKRCITLNLKTDEGRDIFYRLAEKSDVVIQNFLQGTIKKWKVDYDSIAEINPSIIYAAIHGFGERGPYSDKPGLDLSFQGMGGLMSITGEPGGSPTRVGTSVADIVAGMLSAYGITTALFARERMGIGQKVTVSILDGVIALQTPIASQYFATGKIPDRIGSSSPFFGPIDTFETKDRPINVSIFTEKLWVKLCKLMGVEPLISDSRFDSNAKRLANGMALKAILEDEFRQRDADEWLELLEKEGIPNGKIFDYNEVFSDPQVTANEMVLDLEHMIAGKIKVTGLPVKLSKTPGSVRMPAPILGQHTEEVLVALGYDGAEIKKLIENNIVSY